MNDGSKARRLKMRDRFVCPKCQFEVVHHTDMKLESPKKCPQCNCSFKKDRPEEVADE